MSKSLVTGMKLKTGNYHTVGTVLKSNSKIDTITHKNTNVHFPGLVQALQ